MTAPVRDHLFVSYATEDVAFAEWLTLRLTAEGYRVWCDRVKLLGGESYPQDIDVAIKQRTFRFLALLSPHSLVKPNPVKERTLALNLARQRNEQFVIPLNLSGLTAIDLDWMSSDLTFVPFKDAWAKGLAQLIKALDKSGAPRDLPSGPGVVATYVAGRSPRKHEPERLWTNIIEISTMPTHILRLTGSPGAVDRELGDWPRYKERFSSVWWAFEIPSGTNGIRAERFKWKEPPPTGNLRLTNAVAFLLRRYIQRAAIAKGLALSDDGGKYPQLHYPWADEGARWLSYKWIDDSKSRLKACGERNFWVGPDRRETTRYHLSPVFSPSIETFGSPCFILKHRLFLTDVEGKALPLRKAVARRKQICAGWWNDAWLARMLATLQFITDGRPANLALTPTCDITINPIPRLAMSPEGIDEHAAVTIGVEDESAELVADSEEDDTDD